MTHKQKLTPEQFVFLALEKLKKPGAKGIHTVFTGFNQAFRSYFPDSDPVALVKKMVEEGKLVSRPAKGGAMIYSPDANMTAPKSASTALNQMGIGK